MLYTIGFNDKPIRTFLKILRLNNVNCIIDVRTFPYSIKYPNFNENNLKIKLKEKDIYYMNFCNEFGLKIENEELVSKIVYYNNEVINYVDFKTIWKLDSFKNGINRILDGINKEFNICFMDSVSNPCDSHRTYMVSEYLHKLGYKIIHIKDEDIIIDHETMYDRLNDTFLLESKKYKKYKEKMNNDFNLFTTNPEYQENIKYWDDFFSKYTYDKGFFLKNILLFKDNIKI